MSRLSTYFSDLDTDLSHGNNNLPRSMAVKAWRMADAQFRKWREKFYEKHLPSSENGSQSSQKAFKGSKIGRESSVNDHFVQI